MQLLRAAPLALLVSSSHAAAVGGVESSAKISSAEMNEIGKAAELKARSASAKTSAGLGSVLAGALGVAACPACDAKDFSDDCPSGWTAAADGRCKAGAGYTGPCAAEQSFQGADKLELELTCGICWPCSKGAGSCSRDWSAPCPNGYALVESQTAAAQQGSCRATESYDGGCEVLAGPFADQAAKEKFAERCLTSWPCSGASTGAAANAGGEGSASTEEPRAASLARGHSASFLATKVLPVDPYRLRNSLFLSQPLREPAAASLNVVVAEDVEGMKKSAEQKALHDQISTLGDAISEKLKILEA